MSSVEAQAMQLKQYGLNKDTLQTMALVTELLALTEYMKASLSHYLENGIDKQTYILGSSQCFDLLIDKINALFLSLDSNVDKF